MVKLSRKFPKQVGTKKSLLMTKVLDAGDSLILKPVHDNLKTQSYTKRPWRRDSSLNSKIKTSPFVLQVHSKNTDTVFYTITMDSARQKAVLTHMSAKSAQKSIISSIAQSLDKLTNHCYKPLNKAKTLAQTHRSQIRKL